MIKQLPFYMFFSLVCTILIEYVFARFFKIKDKYDILLIVLVNVLTNPLVVCLSFLINIRYGLWIRKIGIVILEFLVIIIEGFFYKKYFSYNKRNPYIISIILNGSSYIIGTLLNLIFF